MVRFTLEIKTSIYNSGNNVETSRTRFPRYTNVTVYHRNCHRFSWNEYHGLSDNIKRLFPFCWPSVPLFASCWSNPGLMGTGAGQSEPAKQHFVSLAMHIFASDSLAFAAKGLLVLHMLLEKKDADLTRFLLAAGTSVS